MTLLYKLLILQFTAHILADFMLQEKKWIDHKEKKLFAKQHVWHALIIFITSYALSFHIGFWKGALFISVLHLGTDILKSLFKVRKDKNYFFLDQLIHLVILGVVSTLYLRYFGYALPFNVDVKTLATVSAVMLCLKPSNIIIKNLLDVFDIEAPQEKGVRKNAVDEEEEAKGLPNAGKLIGIVERLLAFSLILSGQYSAVGFIIAAKSILRFRNTKHSEYVLVGSLLSFGIAIFLALGVSEI
ncbi:MAG: DUF3307 domain-containing protein [Bacteroidota bacterium]